MPLISHGIEGHDEERRAFRFSMLNDDQVVLCQISDAALDELGGAKGTERSVRLAQFLSLRRLNKPRRGSSTKSQSFVDRSLKYFPNTWLLSLKIPIRADQVANKPRITILVELNRETQHTPPKPCRESAAF